MTSNAAHQRFPIAIGRKSRPLLLFFGIRGNNASVDLNEELDAQFGFYRMHTPVANIESFRAEGPWLWITAIGVRRGIFRPDISFDGVHTGGVRLNFREPVKWGLFRVPALYVTVADIDGFMAALRARAIPGEDARRKKR
ncbi:MAG: hypothetical protein ABIP53_09120 [Candidatus Limnocylindrales bacterium]